MRLETIDSSFFARGGRPAARALLALGLAALGLAALGLAGCVGSGAQVGSSHPAAVSATPTPLPVVAVALTSEQDLPAAPAEDHAGHAGHAGHTGHAGHGQHGGGHAH